MEQQLVINENESKLVPFLWTGTQDKLVYNIQLAGRGAKLTMVGLLLGNARHELQMTVNVTHHHPETESNVVVNGVLTDMSNVFFDGVVSIQKGAKHARAKLASHLLLLSNQAKGKIIPSLEILENDVKAGHAATVGKVDAMQLYYLQSRGLPYQLARQLIVEGFLRNTIDQFPKEMQKQVEKEMSHYVTS